VLSDARLRALTLGTALLGLGNLGVVTYRILTYESPDTDGTDIAGLLFGIVIVLAALALLDAVVAGALLRATELSSPARVLVGGGLGAAALTGLGVTVFQFGPLTGVDIVSPSLVRELFLVGVGGGLALGLAALVTLVEHYRDGSTT